MDSDFDIWALRINSSRTLLHFCVNWKPCGILEPYLDVGNPRQATVAVELSVCKQQWRLVFPSPTAGDTLPSHWQTFLEEEIPAGSHKAPAWRPHWWFWQLYPAIFWFLMLGDDHGVDGRIYVTSASLVRFDGWSYSYSTVVSVCLSVCLKKKEKKISWCQHICVILFLKSTELNEYLYVNTDKTN